MQAQGYRVIPVNPNETNVLGEPVYPSLAAVPGTINLVNIFRRSEGVLPIVEEGLLVAPKRFGCKKAW
jgi:predicted CoA-binding protein